MSLTDKVIEWISNVENVFARRVLAVLAYTLLAIIIVVGLVLELMYEIAISIWGKLKQNYRENGHLIRDFVNSFKETW
tara:strand:- start:455 stop:688 length:234 start_codon:yes stop_codon:yes gene_type:complete